MAYAIFSSIFSSLFLLLHYAHGFSNILGHIFQVASFILSTRYRNHLNTLDFLYYELKSKPTAS